jgi:hypothetical protein
MIPTWYPPDVTVKNKVKKCHVLHQVSSSGQGIPEITGPQLLASGVIVSGMPEP